MLQLPNSLQRIIISYLIDIVDLNRLNNIRYLHTENVSYLHYKLPRLSPRLWLQGRDRAQIYRSACVIQRLFLQNKDRLVHVIRHLKTDQCLHCQMVVQSKVLVKFEHTSKIIKRMLINEWFSKLCQIQFIRYIDKYLNSTTPYRIDLNNNPINYIYNIYKRMLRSNIDYRNCLRSNSVSFLWDQPPRIRRSRRSVWRRNKIVNDQSLLDDLKMFDCQHRRYSELKPADSKKRNTKASGAIYLNQSDNYHLNHILRRRELLRKRGIILMPAIFNYPRAIIRVTLVNPPSIKA